MTEMSCGLKENKRAAPGIKAEYSYDHVGRRISKKLYNPVGAGWASTPFESKKFVYDGWNLIAELDGNDNVQKTFVWGIDELLAIKVVGGDTYLPITENRNIVKLVNATTGVIDAEYEYSPFGVLLSESGIAKDISPYRYKTEYFDNESGLYYFGYRFYDPTNGRWLSREPLGEGASLNLYMYCHNDPVNRYDRLGLDDLLTQKLQKSEKAKKAFLEIAYLNLIYQELYDELDYEISSAMEDFKDLENSLDNRKKAWRRNRDLIRTQHELTDVINNLKSEYLGIISSETRLARDEILIEQGMGIGQIIFLDRLGAFGVTTIVDHATGYDMVGSKVTGNKILGISLGVAETLTWVVPLKGVNKSLVKGYAGANASFKLSKNVAFQFSQTASKSYLKLLSELKATNFKGLKEQIISIKGDLQTAVNQLLLPEFELAGTNGLILKMAGNTTKNTVKTTKGVVGGDKKYLYRYISEEDLKLLKNGQDLLPKGISTKGTTQNFSKHINGGDTGLISATRGSADDIATFSSGNGLIRIDLAVLKAEGVHVFDHEFILPLIKGNIKATRLRAFINSQEVLIKGKIPFKAIEIIK